MKDGERDAQVAAIINKEENNGLFAVYPPFVKNRPENMKTDNAWKKKL